VAFARRTGETKGGTCGYCGAAVTLEAVETLDGRAGLHWGPSPHRAPCGAHCLAGSVAHGETDVHIDPYGECPRCGAKAAEVASTVENAEGTERSVLQRYVVGRGGLRIDHERRSDGAWEIVARYPAADDSTDEALRRAESYVPWLRALRGERRSGP